MKDLLCVAVTGSSSPIGQLIVERLLNDGFVVRILTRRVDTIRFHPALNKNLQLISSDLFDPDALKKLVKDVKIVFHCAGEVLTKKLFHKVNVLGTKNILDALRNEKCEFFCYISSAGVVGPVQHKNVITEMDECKPRNMYEKTKYQAEKLIKDSHIATSICIIRPTNIFDRRAYFSWPFSQSSHLIDRAKLFFKGNELARLVDVDDVARAAIYLMERKTIGVNVYFVSLDDDANNSYRNIRKLFHEMLLGTDAPRIYCLDVHIAHFLRTIYRGRSLFGLVKFSNSKLLSTGFSFENMVADMVSKAINSGHKKNS